MAQQAAGNVYFCFYFYNFKQIGANGLADPVARRHRFRGLPGERAGRQILVSRAALSEGARSGDWSPYLLAVAGFDDGAAQLHEPGLWFTGRQSWTIATAGWARSARSTAQSAAPPPAGGWAGGEGDERRHSPLLCA